MVICQGQVRERGSRIPGGDPGALMEDWVEWAATLHMLPRPMVDSGQQQNMAVVDPMFQTVRCVGHMLYIRLIE